MAKRRKTTEGVSCFHLADGDWFQGTSAEKPPFPEGFRRISPGKPIHWLSHRRMHTSRFQQGHHAFVTYVCHIFVQRTLKEIMHAAHMPCFYAVLLFANNFAISSWTVYDWRIGAWNIIAQPAKKKNNANIFKLYRTRESRHTVNQDKQNKGHGVCYESLGLAANTISV